MFKWSQTDADFPKNAVLDTKLDPLSDQTVVSITVNICLTSIFFLFS